MSDLSPRRPAFGIKFWVALHLLLWTAIPTLVLPNITLDDVQILYWGREWQLGYCKHPPLPSWIAESLAWATGRTDAAMFFGAAACISLSLIAAYRLARVRFSPETSLAAVLTLEACHYYHVTGIELNNNTVLIPCWAWLVVSFWNALQRQGTWDWIAVGIWLAAGMYVKYSHSLLILALLATPLWLASARSALRTRGPYVAALTALVLFVPHALWMWESHGVTITYALGRASADKRWTNHLLNPLKFLAAQTLAVGLVLAIFWWGKRRDRAAAIIEKSLPVDSSAQEFQIYVWWVTLAPAALMLALSIVTGARLRSMWGATFWTFLPIALLTLRDWSPAIIPRLQMAGATCALAIPLGFGIVEVAAPYCLARPTRTIFPGRALAQTVDRVWHEHSRQPLRMVGGDWWLAGNAAYYSHDRPTVYAELSELESPWCDDEIMNRTGGVLVLGAFKDTVAYRPRDFDQEFAALQQRFPRLQRCGHVELAYQTGAKLRPTRVEIAIIPSDTETPLQTAAGESRRDIRK